MSNKSPRLNKSRNRKKPKQAKKHARVGAATVAAKGAYWADAAINEFSDYFYFNKYASEGKTKRSSDKNSRKNARESIFLASLISKLPQRHLNLLASEKPFVTPKFKPASPVDFFVRLSSKYYINLIQFASASLNSNINLIQFASASLNSQQSCSNNVLSTSPHPYKPSKIKLNNRISRVNPIEAAYVAISSEPGYLSHPNANSGNIVDSARINSGTTSANSSNVRCNNHADSDTRFHCCNNCTNDFYHALFGKPKHIVESIAPGTQLDPFAPEQACNDAKCRVKELLRNKALQDFAEIYVAHLDIIEALIRDAAMSSKRPTTVLNKQEALVLKHTLNRFSLIMQACLHKTLTSEKPFEALEDFVNLFKSAETSMRTAFLLYISDADETAKAYQTAQFRYNLLEPEAEKPNYSTELAAVVARNCAPEYKNCILHLINTNMNVLKTYYYEGLNAKTNSLMPFMLRSSSATSHSRLTKQYKNSKLSTNSRPTIVDISLEQLKYKDLDTLELFLMCSVTRQKLISIMAKVDLVHPSVSTLVEYPDAVAYTYAYVKGYREPYNPNSVIIESRDTGHYTALTSFSSKKVLASNEGARKHFNELKEFYLNGEAVDGYNYDDRLRRAYNNISVTQTLASSILNNLQTKWAWRKLAKGMEAYSPDLEMLAEELSHLHPIHSSLYTDLRDAPTSYERFDAVRTRAEFLEKLHARTTWSISESKLEDARLQHYKTLALLMCECVAAGLEVPDIKALFKQKLNPTAAIITQVQRNYFTKINVKELKMLFMLGTYSYDTIIELYSRFKTALAVYLIRKRLLSLKQLQELPNEFTKHVAASHIRTRLSALAKATSIAYKLCRGSRELNDSDYQVPIEPLNTNELLHYSQNFRFENSSSNETDVYARHQNLIATILKHRSADSTLNLQLNKRSRSDAVHALESSAAAIESLLTSSSYLNKYNCYPIRLELISEPLKRHLKNHFKGLLERAEKVRESVREAYGEAALKNPYQVNAHETADGLHVTDFETTLAFEEWLDKLLRTKVTAHMKKLNIESFQI